MVVTLELRLDMAGFIPSHSAVEFDLVGKLFTHIASITRQYNLLPAYAGN